MSVFTSIKQSFNINSKVIFYYESNYFQVYNRAGPISVLWVAFVLFGPVRCNGTEVGPLYQNIIFQVKVLKDWHQNVLKVPKVLYIILLD